MPIDVFERPKTRGYVNDPKSRSAKLEYWARGSDVVADIDAAVNAAAPAAFVGLNKQSISTTEEGPSFWYSVVSYGPTDLDETDGSESGEPGETSPPLTESTHLNDSYGFSTSGGTQHINASLNTLSSVGYNGAAVPDNEQGIGVTKDTVEGTDIITGKLELTIDKRISFVAMNDVNRWAKATGTINKLAWNTFAAGEVLFLGCDGKYEGNGTSSETWLVTFKFLISKNNSAPIVIRPAPAGGTGLVVENKRGHDYLWVGFVDEIDGASSSVLKRPMYAYVEEVYDNSNFREVLGF